VTDSVLTEEIEQFIRRELSSIQQLEILLLLRQRADRDWSAAEVSDELRAASDAVGTRLSELADRRLLLRESGKPDRYRYGPDSEARRKLVDGLADAYAQRRYSVIDLILSKPSDPIRVFAGAFRFRKEEDDG
jgi:hypothetical protein